MTRSGPLTDLGGIAAVSTQGLVPVEEAGKANFIFDRIDRLRVRTPACR